jgi:hypothetical protein
MQNRGARHRLDRFPIDREAISRPAPTETGGFEGQEGVAGLPCKRLRSTCTVPCETIYCTY